ncbi:MAG: hypothetical protein AAGA16_23840 [Cyanobacteria bacterium P01_E01_bin.35]
MSNDSDYGGRVLVRTYEDDKAINRQSVGMGSGRSSVVRQYLKPSYKLELETNFDCSSITFHCRVVLLNPEILVFSE